MYSSFHAEIIFTTYPPYRCLAFCPSVSTLPLYFLLRGLSRGLSEVMSLVLFLHQESARPNPVFSFDVRHSSPLTWRRDLQAYRVPRCWFGLSEAVEAIAALRRHQYEGLNRALYARLSMPPLRFGHFEIFRVCSYARDTPCLSFFHVAIHMREAMCVDSRVIQCLRAARLRRAKRHSISIAS